MIFCNILTFVSDQETSENLAVKVNVGLKSGGEQDILGLHNISAFFKTAGPHSTLSTLNLVYLNAAGVVVAREVNITPGLPGAPAHSLTGGERPTGPIVW